MHMRTHNAQGQVHACTASRARECELAAVAFAECRCCHIKKRLGRTCKSRCPKVHTRGRVRQEGYTPSIGALGWQRRAGHPRQVSQSTDLPQHGTARGAVRGIAVGESASAQTHKYAPRMFSGLLKKGEVRPDGSKKRPCDLQAALPARSRHQWLQLTLYLE